MVNCVQRWLRTVRHCWLLTTCCGSSSFLPRTLLHLKSTCRVSSTTLWLLTTPTRLWLTRVRYVRCISSVNYCIRCYFIENWLHASILIKKWCSPIADKVYFLFNKRLLDSKKFILFLLQDLMKARPAKLSFKDVLEKEKKKLGLKWSISNAVLWRLERYHCLQCGLIFTWQCTVESSQIFVTRLIALHWVTQSLIGGLLCNDFCALVYLCLCYSVFFMSCLFSVC